MLENNLWILLLLEGTAFLVLALGTAYIFYPAFTATQSVARNDGLEVVGVRSDANTDVAKASGKQQPDKKSPQILLSVIVPAYNEELRLVIMLQEAYEYLSSTSSAESSTSATNGKTCRALQLLQEAAATSATDPDPSLKDAAITVEWILVNDGSTDETCNIYRDWVQQLPATTATTATNTTKHVFQLLSLTPNAGKGAAVQAGMLAATGDYRLMVDADGATQFGSGLLALATELPQTPSPSKTDSTLAPEPATATTAAVRPEFLLGSRAHLTDDTAEKPSTNTSSGASTSTTVQRSVVRRALQHLFHYFCVQLIGAGDIRDTQCGFKLLTAAAAIQLFGNLHLKRWAFDTEIVFLSARLHVPVREVAVVWTEVDGSKLHTGGPASLAMVAVSMLRDMICVRLCYTLGIWNVKETTTTTASATTSSVESTKSKSA